MSATNAIKRISVSKYKTFMFDIEGTTTPIVFVAENLFPYIRTSLKTHIEETWESDETKKDVLFLKEQAEQDANNQSDFKDAPQINIDSQQSVIDNVIYNMDKDRKMTALKQLQGHMWRSGYESGKILGEVYDDAFDFFERIKKQGKNIYIYSSGSVQAQKLLFQYSTHGNLLPYFVDHFDTSNIGNKLEKSSYVKILEKTGIPNTDILFLTDNIGEAIAAREAGIESVLSVRPGTMKLPEDHTFDAVTTFEHLEF